MAGDPEARCLKAGTGEGVRRERCLDFGASRNDALRLAGKVLRS